ncbi:ligase-associated DNA damage response endonuclease PdeM [Paracoccus ravus]|uniref:ligase-associated DNA damage response endonuclease PdeM n=1 Tax=Paracoccus ravus TaxID=2447760 RepID=UPI00106EFFDE|nr:ligase-associated DNA damage response endonuclease PdeM [Paracoccus ravus]
MTGWRFDFHGLRLEARVSGALWWPEGRWLLVADLHLGKSERMARRGGPLLPPYESIATLDRLGQEVAALDPLRIVSLGDGFDDDLAGRQADPIIRHALGRLAHGRDWLWLCGNHDPSCPEGHPGEAEAVFHLGAVLLRHEAVSGDGPDISGHFHPVLRLAGERKRTFLVGDQHLILPAFGAYTGGLPYDDPALRRLVPEGLALACGRQIHALPIRGDASGWNTKKGRQWRPGLR